MAMTLKEHIAVGDQIKQFRAEIRAIRAALRKPDADRRELLKRTNALERAVNRLEKKAQAEMRRIRSRNR